MITKNINFKNFYIKNLKNNRFLVKKIKVILKSNNELFNSLRPSKIKNYSLSELQHLSKSRIIRLIGIGGSILGAKAIYHFLNDKIKKKFLFIDSIASSLIKKDNKKFLNLIISKSGNTLETIVNSNILIKKKDTNIFITETKNSYLYSLAQKMKSKIIEHNNYIGGRYSVLSEVGMLPADLMGLKTNNFKQLNNLVKNKVFLNSIIKNVSSMLHFIKFKKFNSVILNYDHKSKDLMFWYQQLVAESLGKKGKGVFPIISVMPKDNHSLMQLYLDGIKKNFFTFFFTHEKNSPKIDPHNILSCHNYLKNKNLNKILFAQKNASEVCFRKKNIPFRTFEITQRNEKTLGELFCFFILETILLGEAVKVNPYNQPSVELIKKETKKLLI